MDPGWETTQDRRVKGWLSSIPGYSGYRDKERRRDADKRVRDALSQQLEAVAKRTDVLARGLADERKITEVGAVESASRAIRHLADVIRTATYGYGGLFGDRSVDAQALDQLRLFDEALGLSVTALADQVGTAESALRVEGDALATALATIQTTVRATLGRWDLRNQVIETARPAGPAEVGKALDVLKTVAEREESGAPHPLFDIVQGEAIAVMGDNFVVDSRIDIVGDGVAFRLFRISASPAEWLLVQRAHDAEAAVLRPVEATVTDLDSPRIDGKSFTAFVRGQATAEVTGVSGASGSRAASVGIYRNTGDNGQLAAIVDWGTESLVLVGSPIESDDVERYGATASS